MTREQLIELAGDQWDADSSHVRYPEDCKRIRQVLRDRGFNLTFKECEELWEYYSDSYAAGWLILDSHSDNDIHYAAQQWAVMKLRTT